MTEKKEPPKWATRTMVVFASIIAGLVLSIIIGALALAATSIWGAVLR